VNRLYSTGHAIVVQELYPDNTARKPQWVDALYILFDKLNS